MDLKTGVNVTDLIAVLKDTTGKITSNPINSNGTTVNLLVNKNPDEPNFELSLGSQGFFIPAEMPDIYGPNNDTRKLSYMITRIDLK